METRTVKLYPFAELKSKAQAKVLNRHRYWNVDDNFWKQEIIARFKKDMLEIFGIEVREIFYDFDLRLCFTTKQNVDLIKFKQTTGKLSNWSCEQLQELSDCYMPKFNIEHVRVLNGIGEMRIYDNPHITDRYLATMTSECERDILEHCNSKASELFAELKKEYEFQTSDEQVAASIIANEITFFLNGDAFKEDYE